MIVVLSSVRGSPGVTSWALLLAAAWPPDYGVERVVLEADPDGGVIGARYGLGVDPGVVSLIAGLRRSEGELAPVADHGRAIDGATWLVPGPETSEQARPLWTALAGTVASRAATEDRVWLVDAGRLDAASPLAPFARRSALTLVVTRPAAENLVQVPARVATLQGLGATVGVLVAGRSGYGTGELAEFFGTGLVWPLPETTSDLPQAVGAALNGGRARRSWLWRRAVEVAAELAERITPEYASGHEPDGPRPLIGWGAVGPVPNGDGEPAGVEGRGA